MKKKGVQEKVISGMKEFLKQRGLLYGLAFLLPIIIMLIVFKSRGFFPFGDKTLFIMDMKGQYLEFFASLRNVVSGDDSIFFSWSRSMGGNYLGLFAYYVASPLSFLTLFFPLKKLTSAIVLLTVLKIGLAGFSFSAFGAYIWQRETITLPGAGKEVGEKDVVKSSRAIGVDLLVILPFAVCYALISYNMVYSLCLMWLDGVILLPVILLGVEKILDGRKGLHYMLALAALFICNYYTGYMVGVFTALYTMYRVLCRIGKSTVKEYIFKIARFAVATFLAFGLSAPLILPVVKDLMQGKLATNTYVPDTKTNFVFIELFGKFKNGIYDSITNAGLPAIYCGYLVILLAVVFFILRGISIREKLGAVLILALLASSFYFTKWDIAWHGFQYPTWFPYRYAFVFSFFLLFMAVRSISEIDKIQKIACSPTVVKTAAILVATLIVSMEMGTNGKAMFAGLEGEFGYGTVEEYEAFLDKTQPLVDQITTKDESFYRINQGYEYSKNDAMLLGYHGMTHYSSTFHAAVNALMPKLGIAQSHIWNSGYGSNPLTDSLFAVKYILDDGMVPSNYTKISDSAGGASIYQNENMLPIAYSTPAMVLCPDLSSADIFDNQNILLNAIAGTQQSYFTKYECTMEQPDTSWSYTFTADSDNPVYLYMKSDNGSWSDIFVNDAWVGNYFSTETSCSLYLGNFQSGQQVVVRVVPSNPITLNYAVIGQLHMDVLQETMNNLQEGGMDVTYHKNGKLSGNITVGEHQRILTSIPYDSGWTVKVDGKKVETEMFLDTFLAMEVESGDHKIEFSYVSPGFGKGMALFAVTIILLAVYVVLTKSNSGAKIGKNKRNSDEEKST